MDATSFRHRHAFTVLVASNVTACFEKGVREFICAEGDIKACECAERQFFPHDPRLSDVPLEGFPYVRVQ